MEFALRQMGTNTLPFLLKRLGTKDSRIKPKIEEWAGKQDVIRVRLNDNAHKDRATAVAAFEILGPVAKPAIPDLQKMLNNTDNDFQVANALAGIGPDAIPALTNTWSHSKPAIRRSGFTALVDMGTNAETALPFLVMALRDADPDIRWAAALAMWHVGSTQPALVIPPLVKSLDESDTRVSRTAIGSLGRFGARAKAAVPRLTELLTQVPESGSAALALASIMGTNQSLPLIAGALTKNDARVQSAIIDVLGTFETNAHDAIPFLLPFARNDDEALRNLTIRALIKIGPRSEAILPVLIHELTDTDSTIRNEVLVALAAFGPKAEAAVPILLEQIEVLTANDGQFPRTAGSPPRPALTEVATSQSQVLFRGIRRNLSRSKRLTRQPLTNSNRNCSATRPKQPKPGNDFSVAPWLKP